MNTQLNLITQTRPLILFVALLFLSMQATAATQFNGAADSTVTLNEDGSARTSFSFSVSNDDANAYEMDFIVQADSVSGADKNTFRYSGTNCDAEKCIYGPDESGTVQVTWQGYPASDTRELNFSFHYCEIPKYLLFKDGAPLKPRFNASCPTDSRQTVRETVAVEQANPPGTVRFTQSDVSVDEDAGTVTLTAERVNGSGGSLTAKIVYESETANLDEDFRAGPASITWDDGEDGRKSFTVPIIADDLAEEDETFAVELVTDSRSTAQVTIIDVEPESAGIIDIDDSCCDIREDSGTVTVTVNRLEGTAGRISVTYTDVGPRGSREVIEQMATPDEDYQSFSGELVWEDGDASSRTIRITVFEDELVEGDEYFNIAFGNPTGGANLGFNQEWPLVIEDVTPQRGAVQFSATSRTVDEGQDVLLTVERVNGTAGAASVEWYTETGNDDGTATADQDFTAGSGTLRWESGQGGNREVRVPTLSDSLAESDETFTVRLRNANGVEIGNSSAAVATISDLTDFGSIAFAQGDYSGREDADSVPVILKRNGGSDGRVSVRVRSANDTATAGNDYTAINQLVTWEDGDSADKTVSVVLAEDEIVEEDEQFTLSISEATGGASLGNPSSATFVIQNTTAPRFGSIGFQKSSVDGGISANPLLIYVERTGGFDGQVSVDYVIGTDADTAVLGTDYSVESQSGTLVWTDQSAEAKELEIRYLNPAPNNLVETLTVRLSDPSGGATLGISEILVSFPDEGLAADTSDIEIVSGRSSRYCKVKQAILLRSG